jgi:hypothetical protein
MQTKIQSVLQSLHVFPNAYYYRMEPNHCLPAQYQASSGHCIPLGNCLVVETFLVK